MKITSGNGEIKNSLPNKYQDSNFETAFMTEDERGAQKEKFDRNRLSEDDLDRIMACS